MYKRTILLLLCSIFVTACSDLYPGRTSYYIATDFNKVNGVVDVLGMCDIYTDYFENEISYKCSKLRKSEV